MSTLLPILLAFICIAGGLAWYLTSHDHGPKEPILALWMAFGLGAVGAGIAYFLETRFLSATSLVGGGPQSQLLGTTLAIGVIEECSKFIPLALILYNRKFFNEHTDGVIYFALAGLGFGLPENILYTLQGGEQTGLTRVFLTPVFHATTTAIVGYFLAKGKLNHKSPFLVIIPLAFAIVIHGLYDFGLLSGSQLYTVMSIVITLCLTGTLFLLFSKATDHDQDMGLSVVGHNSFCRSCGKPNLKHNLYCAHCGKNA